MLNPTGNPYKLHVGIIIQAMNMLAGSPPWQRATEVAGESSVAWHVSGVGRRPSVYDSLTAYVRHCKNSLYTHPGSSLLTTLCKSLYNPPERSFDQGSYVRFGMRVSRNQVSFQPETELWRPSQGLSWHHMTIRPNLDIGLLVSNGGSRCSEPPEHYTVPYEPWSKLLVRGLHRDYMGSS